MRENKDNKKSGNRVFIDWHLAWSGMELFVVGGN